MFVFFTIFMNYTKYFLLLKTAAPLSAVILFILLLF